MQMTYVLTHHPVDKLKTTFNIFAIELAYDKTV